MPYDANTITRPRWADVNDRECDVSDVWMEHRDPQNEIGAMATACLGYGWNDESFEVKGVVVEDRDMTRFYDRDWCMENLGIKTLWHIEELEMEAQGEEDRANGGW